MPRNSDDVLIELPGDGVLGELPGNDACGEVNESDEGDSTNKDDKGDEGDEAGHVVEPLQLYIEAKVRKISDELDYSQSLRTSVERAFRDSVDGTFLWVDL